MLKNHFVALCTLLVAGSLHAQAPEVITLDAALERVRTQSATVLEAELNRDAQAAEVSAARAAFLPAVNAFVQPSQRYGLAFDQTTGQLSSQTNESMSVGLDVSFNLFNGFGDRAALVRARALQDAAGLSVERTRQEAAAAVAGQFLQVLLDAELVTIRRGALAAQEEMMEQVASLVEGGRRPRADLSSQRAVVAEAELALLEAEQTSALSQSRLVRLLQLDPLGTYAFAAPNLAALDDSADYALAALLPTALRQRADLQAQARQIAAAGAGIREARSGRLPTVSLFVATSTGYTSLASQTVLGADGQPVVTDPGVPVVTADGTPVLIDGEPFIVGTRTAQETTPLFAQFRDNRGGSVGLSIQIPLFDRAVTRRQVAQAQIEAERARLAREIQEQDIAVEVREALIAYDAAGKRMDVTALQLEAATEALAAEQDRYAHGASTLAELAQARARFVQAQADRAQARYTRVFRRLALAYAVGAPDARHPLVTG